MAEVIAHSKPTIPTPVATGGEVILKLTYEEAIVLYALLGGVSGDSNTSARREAEAVYDVLRKHDLPYIVSSVLFRGSTAVSDTRGIIAAAKSGAAERT